MPLESSAKDSRTSYLILEVPGAELVVPYYQGDFSAGDICRDQRETVAYSAQGAVHTLRKGNRINIELSFTAHFPEMSSLDRDTLADFIAATGKYAGRARSMVVSGDGDAIDVRHVIRGDGMARDEFILYQACALKAKYSSSDPDSLAVSGTSYGEIVRGRSAS